MGTAYRRNWKNLTGKDDVTGHEVLSVGIGSLSTAGSATPTPDAFGVTTFTMPRAARLEGLTAYLSGTTLVSGSLTVDLLVNAQIVGTATLDATSPASAQVLLKKEDGNELTLASGDVVGVQHTVVSNLSSTQVLSAKVHLAMLE